MKHPTSLKLHAHWDAARAGRAAPGRDEIDLASIRDVLASVFLLDAPPGPAEAAFRLSGTRLDALFGRPLRGTAFRQIWSPRSAPAASAALARATGGACPAVVAARGGPPGRDPVELEILLLPLDGGRRALGSLAAFATPGWMGLAAAAPLDFVPPAPPADRRTRGAPNFGRRRPKLDAPVPPAGGRTGTPPAAARP